MAFATSDQLRVHLGLESIDATRADQLLSGAEGLIKREAHQTIEEVADDVAELRGTWDRTLKLPQRPVTAVSTVVLRDAAGSSHTITSYAWSRQGRLTRTDDGAWGGPDATVTVTYSHGYATVPNDIVTLTLHLAARAWVNPAGLGSESLDGHAVRFGPNMLTDAERELLSDYSRSRA